MKSRLNSMAPLHTIEIEGNTSAEGEDFAQLAKQHSSHSGSAARGGQLGWARRGGTLDPVLEEAAFEAQVGGTFRAETVQGLHLVQVTAERCAQCFAK